MTRLSSVQLVGTWRLVFFAAYGADGRETTDFGPTPRGSLMYDQGGRMSVNITHSERKPFESDNGYFGYFGSYTVDESAGTVTHHIEGAAHPNYVGTDQRRFFTLQGDRLVLSTQPEQAAEADARYVATWERQV